MSAHEPIDANARALCEAVASLLRLREPHGDSAPLGPHTLARLTVSLGLVVANLDARARGLAPVPGELRLSNGMPCISVDHAKQTIGVIVPEGFELLAMTPHSGQELTTTPRVLADRSFASAHVLRTVTRAPPPTVGRLPPEPGNSHS